jgi:hypothetical protein
MEGRMGFQLKWLYKELTEVSAGSQCKNLFVWFLKQKIRRYGKKDTGRNFTEIWREYVNWIQFAKNGAKECALMLSAFFLEVPQKS